jgi:hypothetical protein
MYRPGKYPLAHRSLKPDVNWRCRLKEIEAQPANLNLRIVLGVACGCQNVKNRRLEVAPKLF